MRLTQTHALLGLIGVAAAGVLVAAASGGFADSAPDSTGLAPQGPAAERISYRLVDRPPVLEPPASAIAAPERAPAPVEQEEWRFPALPQVKAALPRDATDTIQRPAAVMAPGEQQAAWAARDKLANAFRAGDGAAVSPVLTRLHEGPPPDKTGPNR